MSKMPAEKSAVHHLQDPLRPVLLGALAGAVGGGMVAPKGKLLKYVLGGTAGGGLLGGTMGVGGNVGSLAGDALSRGLGMDDTGAASFATRLSGRLAGLGGGAYLGMKAYKRIGEELEHEDESNKKEKSAMSLYSFGAKVAGYVDLHNAPKPAKKQLPPHEVFNNALMRAQSAGESSSPDLFHRIQKEHDHAQKKEKKAQSSCSPCAMPNGPTNKKPYTSASPAVMDASQQSEEIGKPETTETQHDKSIVTGKVARAFGADVGRKLAYELPLPSPEAWAGKPQPAELSDPRTGMTSTNGAIDIDRAMRLPATTTKQDRWPGVNPNLENLTTALEYADAPRKVFFNALDYTRKGIGGWAGDVAGTWLYGSAAKPAPLPGGNPDTSNTALVSKGPDGPVPGTTRVPGTSLNRFLAALKNAQPKPVYGPAAPGFDDKYNQIITDVTNPSSSKPGNWAPFAPETRAQIEKERNTPREDPFDDNPKPNHMAQAMEFLNKHKYPIGAGLGALGLGGLLYHLNSGKKKKKNNEDEE